jgi:steroid delta-isomerase-like uncharacterized protein
MTESVEQHNTEIIQRVIKAFNERDMSLLENSVTPGFLRHDLSGAFLVKHTGGAEVTNFLQALFAAFPDIILEVKDLIASGDRVVIRYRFAGTHTGDLFGAAATGKQVDFDGINIYRLEEKKVAEVWQLWDWAKVLDQIGTLKWDR